MAIFLMLFLFLNFCKPILASEDRNIFGLHLTQPEDIHQAKDVINSGGGDWGWATIVIRSDQLNHDTWQGFFDNCRRYHIIPIVRLATTMKDGYWTKPEYPELDKHAEFFNSLKWPTATQHITIFNEINHGSEWGGAVDIKDYVDKLIYASQKFKSMNPNFFILSAGLDLAPPEKPPAYKSAPNVYREIIQYRPDFFDHIDGIASHSYPNHGYIGTPNDRGQHSILGYQWELSFIKSLGITKDLPVFITETGWPHSDGSKNKRTKYYTANTAANFLNTSLDMWLLDPKIKAVTPFIFNYPNPPFENFSWLNQEQQLYPAFNEIVAKQKTINKPHQITSYELVDFKIPFLIFTNTDYSGEIILKNTGQSIWGENNFCLTPNKSSNVQLDAVCTSNELVFPNKNYRFSFKFRIISEDEQENTFLSWDGLPNFEIRPITNNPTIFRTETHLKEKIVNFIRNMFI